MRFRLYLLLLIVLLPPAILGFAVGSAWYATRQVVVAPDASHLVLRWSGGYGLLDPLSGPAFAAYRALVPSTMGEQCSLFFDGTSGIYGRSFDWYDGPVLVLLADPPHGRATISVVDIAYLGLDRGFVRGPLPWTQRLRLVVAPLLPFDGMNEDGLVIGMAAVPRSDLPRRRRRVVHPLVAIRLALDRASTVEDALALWSELDFNFSPGPMLHLLVADRDGHSALVEFSGGRMQIRRSERPFEAATNFLEIDGPREECERHNLLERELGRGERMSTVRALELLRQVSLQNTLWSAVYDQRRGTLDLVLRKSWDNVHHYEMPH